LANYIQPEIYLVGVVVPFLYSKIKLQTISFLIRYKNLKLNIRINLGEFNLEQEKDNVANNGLRRMQKDDLYWNLIQAGHTAIFSWVAVYVASGIALIQMVIQILNIHTLFSFSLMVFSSIYLALICLMTLALYSIVKIMHKQNYWASQFPDELKIIYFKSRSELTKRIMGETIDVSIWEKMGIALHLAGFLFFGVGLVSMNILSFWFFHIRGF